MKDIDHVVMKKQIRYLEMAKENWYRFAPASVTISYLLH